MARTHRKARKTRKALKGGGYGFTGLNSAPFTAGTVSNPYVASNIGDCRAARPDGWIPFSQYAQYQGLPGMNGGKRRSKKSRKAGRRRRTMKGGRYSADFSAVADVTPNGAAWWAGTYMPVQRIACEGGHVNPLNPGPHVGSGTTSQPQPVASDALRGGPLNQVGGAATTLSPATVGVGDVDSMYYYAPTAGYDNKPSTWVDSVGAPVQLQIPYAARAMNPACLTTGHPPPLTGALQKGGKRSRRAKRAHRSRKSHRSRKH